MAFLQLWNSDKQALVDDEDLPLTINLRWRLAHHGYVVNTRSINGKYTVTYLHRLVMRATEGIRIDHKFGNKLDCRKENLRPATQTQNLGNSTWNKTGKTSKFRGVSWHKFTQKWRASLRTSHPRNTLHLGVFVDETEAARAYNTAAIKHFGADFARLNAA